MYRWDGSELSPLYVSKGFSNLYGEDGYDVIKRGTRLDFDVVHPDDLPGLQDFILSHIEKTGQLVTYRYRVWNKRRKDYIWIQLTANVKRQQDGTSIAYVNYANIDAEVKAAREIRWQRSVYSILENIDTGTLYQYCYLYDIMEEKISQALFVGIQGNLYLKTGVLSFATGHVYEYEDDYANRQLKITEYEVVRAQYTQDHVLPEDVEMVMQQNAFENVKKQLRSNQKEISFMHRARMDGMLRHYQVLFAMVPTRDDLCISVVRDITDLVMESDRRNAKLQKALAAANAATQAKSEFLSRMSHEIRTPMNAIMGMTAIAQDNKSDFLQVSDCLSKIDSSSQYLLTLINDILEMSRIESGKIQPHGKFRS